MSHWKAKSPGEVIVPSSVETAENLKQHMCRTLHPSASFPGTTAAQPFQIVNAESLVSPVDPVFLEGASSRALFGLDIGGTLCKVVYFEPSVDKDKDCLRSSKSENNFATREKIAKGKFSHSESPGFECERPESNGDFLAGEISSGFSVSSSKEENVAEFLVSRLDLEDDYKESASRETETVDLVEENCVECSCCTPRVQPRSIDRGDDLNSKRRARKIWVSSHEPVHLPGRGTLYFKCFETWLMEDFLNLTKEYQLVTGGRAIGATGGGAKKFSDQFLEIAGLQLQKADELRSLVRGIDFLASNAQQESFEYLTGCYKGGIIQRPWQPENSSDDASDISSGDEVSPTFASEKSLLNSTLHSNMSIAADLYENETPEKQKRVKKVKGLPVKGPVIARIDNLVRVARRESLHPYLVVNIGSGVSILRVDSPEKFERVGGTSLGGSTFLGLASALTGCTSFEEAINLSMQGDSTQVDMLVGDIYGGDYTEMNLAATTVASSFGKLVHPGKVPTKQAPQHLAKAALLMVTNNIGSIAWLHARNSGVRSIMFTGSFLHNNKLAMRLLSVAMDFWSKGNMKAVFLRHEGHAGAVGALLSALDPSNSLEALLLK